MNDGIGVTVIPVLVAAVLATIGLGGDDSLGGSAVTISPIG